MSHAVPHSASLRIGWGEVSRHARSEDFAESSCGNPRLVHLHRVLGGTTGRRGNRRGGLYLFQDREEFGKISGTLSKNERLRLPFQFDNQTYSVPRSCRMKEKRLRQQLVGPSPRRSGWSLSRVMVVSDDGFATPSLCPGCRRPFFASVDAPLG
jgi:hypothetical protein